MSGPFRMMPEKQEPGEETREPVPDRLRSLIRGHKQVNGGRWFPVTIYLGEVEWNDFQEQAFSDEWLTTAHDMIEWQYEHGKHVVLRKVIEHEFCKVFGDKLVPGDLPDASPR